MNISPVKMYNASKPINFGMLKVYGIVSPSTVKSLTEDKDFIELVQKTDDNGYDTVIKGNWRDHSICVENKENHGCYAVALSNYKEPLDATIALYNWDQFKRQMDLGVVPDRTFITKKDDSTDRIDEMVEKFNRDRGYTEEITM